MKQTILRISCAALLLAVGVGALLTFTPLGSALRVKLGFFDRKHYEAVVAQVRTMSPAAGGEIQLRLDDPADPASLRKLKPGEFFHRGDGAGNVWARVAPDGKLKVVIQTRDLGHAGEHGFAYSDVPLTPTAWTGAWSFLDVPGRLQLVQPDMKIDDHWWKVLNNLD